MAAFNISQPNDSVSKEDLLWEENENMAKTLIPVMAFVGFIMVTGFFGNILVCYIFTRKIPLSVNTFLLVFLAALDLVNCTLAMPFEIMDMRYSYLFESGVTCKIFRFIVAFPNIDSTFVLLIITIDRYKRVCKPMSIQMTFRDSRKYVTIATAAAILLSLPALLIYGSETVKTSTDGLYGQDCKSSDTITGSVFRFIFQLLLGVGIIMTCGILCYIYIHVWREIRKHEMNIRKKTQFVLLDNSRKLNITSASPYHQSEDTEDEPKGTREMTSGKRITFIAFTVTVVFLLSYLPPGIIMAVRSVPDQKWPLSGVWSRIFLRFYFLSSMTNPLVYGFMSKRFRQECFNVFVPKRLVKWRGRRSPRFQSTINYE
ncbi:rhodopsin, GQ-coupled-like [Haliotis cracherodii]|uniref:rhodopsin, GQ-coupled-like n=1 Tax=Haliotis cracherodii TaxID=6455 RepID=UPI0039EC975D